MVSARDLTGRVSSANTNPMAYSFMIFDFGGNEEAAQQARHRIDGWRQGFRLDKKMQLKFDRKESQEEPESVSSAAVKEVESNSKKKSASKKKSKSGDESGSGTAATAQAADIRMIVRLDFSDHEKLSHHRWLERIPGEEPFKTANPKIVRPGDPDFESTSEKFESLD